MTRKEFRELAEILGQTKRDLEDGILPKSIIFEDLQDDIASLCKRSNANFDRARFVEAIEKAAK